MNPQLSLRLKSNCIINLYNQEQERPSIQWLWRSNIRYSNDFNKFSRIVEIRKLLVHIKYYHFLTFAHLYLMTTLIECILKTILMILFYISLFNLLNTYFLHVVFKLIIDFQNYFGLPGTQLSININFYSPKNSLNLKLNILSCVKKKHKLIRWLSFEN